MTWALERWQVSRRGIVFTLAAGAVVGLGSVAGPEYVFAGSMALVLIALTLFDLTFGVVLITVLTCFESIATFGSGVTFAKLAGTVVILSWLMLAANRRSEIRLLFVDQPLFTYSTLVFLGWASASALWAVDSHAALAYAGRVWLVVALLFVAYSAIRQPRDMRLVLWSFVVGVLATSFYGLSAGLYARDRLVGGIANPNDLAAALVPAVIIALALGVTGTGTERLAGFGSACLIGVALFLTSSRGGLLGLAVGLVVAVLVSRALRRYVVAALMFLVVLGVVNYAFIATAEERTRLSSISSRGSSGRTDIWNVGLRVAHDHPVNGVGLDNFSIVEPQYAAANFGIYQIREILRHVVPHNVYVQLLAELGTVGLLTYACVVAGVMVLGFGAVRKLARAGDWRTETLGQSMLIALVSLLAVFFFHNGLVQKEFWLFAGMIVSLTVLADRAAASSVDARERVEALPAGS